MQIRVSTKSDPANQGFRRAALSEQADTSRAELRRDSVYILYLHNPDLTTDLDDALEGINDLYQQGFFEEFGLSNFPAWQIMQIFMKCKEKGFPLPKVYQGAYNALTRQVESEILPCCRMLGMRFNAYSPFAAGLLQQPWADGSLSELRGEERGRYYGSGSRLSTWVGAKDEGSLADALVRVDTACRDAVRSPTQSKAVFDGLRAQVLACVRAARSPRRPLGGGSFTRGMSRATASSWVPRPWTNCRRTSTA